LRSVLRAQAAHKGLKNTPDMTSVPLVVAISTTLGARSGLLVRDRRGLDEARNVNAVFFVKTGTLTRGELLRRVRL
jgi:cation transport ATPase